MLRFLSIPTRWACGLHVRSRHAPTSTREIHHQPEPLRILYCGSDEFSIVCLEALQKLKQSHADRVASIDVLCRPGKLVGRGRKAVREVPIANVARTHHLPLHQIDGFRGWKLPQAVDLIIAVSFGLLIPARIIGQARYGGINVHPSMLPQFRGPAPLHHTLLQKQQHAGVTVQTLHPTTFDRGLVLAQTPKPGVYHECSSVPELRDLLADEGARLLLHCITNSTFVPPLQPLHLESPPTLIHAAKIGPRDRQVQWEQRGAQEILLRHQVIGPLWCHMERESVHLRVIFSSGFELVERSWDETVPAGVLCRTSDSQVIVQTCDQRVLAVRQVKVEGQAVDEPIRACRRAGLYLHDRS